MARIEFKSVSVGWNLVPGFEGVIPAGSYLLKVIGKNGFEFSTYDKERVERHRIAFSNSNQPFEAVFTSSGEEYYELRAFCESYDFAITSLSTIGIMKRAWLVVVQFPSRLLGSNMFHLAAFEPI